MTTFRYLWDTSSEALIMIDQPQNRPKMKRLFCLLAGLVLPLFLLISCEKKPIENEQKQSAGTVKGVITDIESGEGMADYYIEIRNILYGIYASTRTDTNGNFLFENLTAPGTYAIEVSPSPQYFAVDGVEAEKTEEGNYVTEISLEPNQIREVEIKAKTYTSTLRGRVQLGNQHINSGLSSSRFDFNEFLLAFQEVELLPIGLKTITDEFGNYAFEDVKRGTYTIKVHKDGLVDYNQEIFIEAGYAGWQREQTHHIEMKVDQVYEPQEPSIKENFVNNIDGLGLEMVYVQGGTFFRHHDPYQSGNLFNINQFVHIDSYYIGKYEITCKQWSIIMGEESPIGYKGADDDYPISNVSWEDAQKFCEKLSELSGDKYMLPTEAQWEYAARGGRRSHYYSYSGNSFFDSVGWFSENSEYRVHLVGTKAPNELGIYDMSGNVYEWCLDWGGHDTITALNPQGFTDQLHVVRGGSWNSRADWNKISDDYYDENYSFFNQLEKGFRVAVIVK